MGGAPDTVVVQSQVYTFSSGTTGPWTDVVTVAGHNLTAGAPLAYAYLGQMDTVSYRAVVTDGAGRTATSQVHTCRADFQVCS
jgi:hypothetical protein